jgi:hypothetical protein
VPDDASPVPFMVASHWVTVASMNSSVTSCRSKVIRARTEQQDYRKPIAELDVLM